MEKERQSHDGFLEIVSVSDEETKLKIGTKVMANLMQCSMIYPPMLDLIKLGFIKEINAYGQNIQSGRARRNSFCCAVTVHQRLFWLKIHVVQKNRYGIALE